MAGIFVKANKQTLRAKLSMPGSVEAVVVNFNAGKHLQVAVDSLLEDGIKTVWIVNNAADDGSCDFVSEDDPRIRIIFPEKNLGYGMGVNLGFENVQSDYLVVSNPDIEVGRGSIQALLADLEADTSHALVGPKIINSDGTTYPSVRSFPRMTDAAFHAILGQVAPGNPFTRRYRMTETDHSQSFDADWVSGAFFMVKSGVFRKIGGFSPEFFMYLEDVFLCYTLAEHGYTVRYCGSASVRHAQGVTTSSRPLRMVIAHHHSLWVYAKLTTLGMRRLQLPFIAVGILVRLVISVILTLLRRSTGKPAIDFEL